MDGSTNGANGLGSKSCGPLTDYYIPDYILKPDSEPVLIDNAPSCPVVVFINSKSGGQLGSGLIKTYRELLNVAQVPGLAFREALMSKHCIHVMQSSTLYHGLIAAHSFAGF
jgi:hypothetical protein